MNENELVALTEATLRWLLERVEDGEQADAVLQDVFDAVEAFEEI